MFGSWESLTHCHKVLTLRQSDAESHFLPLLPTRKQAGERRPNITIKFLTHYIGKDNPYYITRGDKQHRNIWTLRYLD